MKNYKFFFGLLIFNVPGCMAHASTGMPNAQEATSKSMSAAFAPAESVNGAHLTLLAQARYRPAPDTLHLIAPMPKVNFRSDELVNQVHLPSTLHYADAHRDPGRVLPAQTTMTAQTAVLKDIIEPGSDVLLLVGLSALAIAVRRQSTS